MITGFNTDIEHGGVVYHVQTEDKGLTTPLILSLVYVGGAILASKRTSYDDLIAAGLSEHELAERLQRQHKLICAAIKAGRVEDLKRMAPRESETGAQTSPSAPAKSPPVRPSAAKPAAPPTAKERPIDLTPAAKKQERRAPLRLDLITNGELYAGQTANLRVRVTRAAQKGREPIQGANVTLKILGTNFRPVVVSEMTNSEGLVLLTVVLPNFKTGRGAILAHVVFGNEEAELRRVVHPA